MDSRKIQKVGSSTLTISLPKDWAETQNLKKGDQLFVVRDGDALKLLPTSIAQKRMEREALEFIIDSDQCGEDGMLERIIVGNYVLGRERFVVKSSGRISSEHLEEMRMAAKRLMGLGIIEETSNKVVLQCSIEPTKYPIDALIKRLYNLGITMLDESLEGLITKDRKLAMEAIKREDDADMMYWLLVRLLLSAEQDDTLFKALGMDSRMNISGNRLIAKELETVADYGEEIAKNVIELIDRGVQLEWPVVKIMKELSDDIKHLYSNALAALLLRDLRLANETAQMRATIERKERELMKLVFERVHDSFVLLSLRNIIDGIRRMAEYAFSIAVIAINRYLERPSPICKPQLAK